MSSCSVKCSVGKCKAGLILNRPQHFLNSPINFIGGWLNNDI